MARRLDNNAILSITATIVSISALFLAAYQTILMRQQQSAAVWPKLIISHGYIENMGDSSFYHLNIRNVGIGPALIRQVRIENRGQQFSTMQEYGRAILRRHHGLDSLQFDAVDLLPEEVIPANQTIRLFDTYRSRFARYFAASQEPFIIIVDYESVYGEKQQVRFSN